MKFKKLVVASAMAVAALSGQAMAAAPGINTTPDVDVYLTGDSVYLNASTNIHDVIAARLFGYNTPGMFNSYHVFYDDGGNGGYYSELIGTNYRAYYGTLQYNMVVNSPIVGSVILYAGTKVRFIHRAKKGGLSGNPVGVNAVARTQPIAWMKPSINNCTLQTNTSLAYQYFCAEWGSDTNATDPGNRIPDFGVSDTEPAMYKASLNVEGNTSGLSDTELATLNITPVSSLLFGIPATTSVPAGINFTRGLVSSLLSGLIQDWTAVNTGLTGKTQVVICRRTQGSSTQAIYNAYFNNFPCAANSYVPGVAAPSRMADSAGYTETSTTITVNPDAGFTVIENPTESNVYFCLQKAQTGGTHMYSYLTDAGILKTVSVNFGTGGYRAIGMLSLISIPNLTWNFRDLNGQAPTKTNLRNGNYDFFGELSMQYNNNGHNNYYPIAGLNDTTNWVVAVNPDGTYNPAGRVDSISPTYVKKKRAFIEEFISLSSNPSILMGVPYYQTQNVTAALPLAYVPDETSSDPADKNVMYVTRQGNACSPVVRYPYPGL